VLSMIRSYSPIVLLKKMAVRRLTPPIKHMKIQMIEVGENRIEVREDSMVIKIFDTIEEANSFVSYTAHVRVVSTEINSCGFYNSSAFAR
jgi:hypothetical protein